MKNIDKNFSIIFNKIKHKNYFTNNDKINDKINELIRINGDIDYNNYDYECHYKTMIYGSSGATFELEKINKIIKKD
jgi:hypothetical protein